MKANKLASGKYSITDLTEDEYRMLIRGCQYGKNHYNTATVPQGKPEDQRRIRQKMDTLADDFANMGIKLGRAMR